MHLEMTDPEFALEDLPELPISEFAPELFEPEVSKRLNPRKILSRWDDLALEHLVREIGIGRCESHVMCEGPDGRRFWFDAYNI